MVQGSWAAWLPEWESPAALSDAQVLALCGSPAPVDDPTMSELLDRGLLLRESVANAAEATELDFPHSPAPLPPTWRLNRHLALRPGPGGFRAFSARRRCYVRLPPPVVVAWTNSTSPGPGSSHARASDEELERALEELGFALPDDELAVPQIRNNEAIAFARHAASGVSRALAERIPSDDLSGRIPVYFVGCIDRSQDMGYGYVNLSLGMLMASIRAYRDGRLNDRYYVVPHILLKPSEALRAARTYGPGVVFFSNYIWAHQRNLETAKRLQRLDRRFLTVFGGPQAPSYPDAAEDMLRQHPYVDILARGEGEETAADLLDRLQWSSDGTPDTSTLFAVRGITLRDPSDSGIMRTPDRPPIAQLSDLPSPYLDGTFDDVPREILYGATLETNRGCPYGCTFCDWGSATRQKIRKFDLERVRAELDWMGRSGVSVIFCADANFGIFERDVEIAEMIADVARRHPSLRQITTNYAKNATDRLAEIIRIFSRAGLASEGVLSIQTRDVSTLHTIRRGNIATERYDELVEVFRSEKLPLSTDLMIGLPGATPESFKSDLQHYFESGVQAKAFLTRVLVNSPMADPAYLSQHDIQIDERGFIRSCTSFNEQDRAYMLELFALHSLAVGYGLFKYVLRYIQWDLGLVAMDVLDALLREMAEETSRFPLLRWTLGFLESQRRSPGGWQPVMEEFVSFLRHRYGIQTDSAFETVLQVQLAVLADPDKDVEGRIALPHDFVRYYRDGPDRAPLREYGPGTLTIDDPHGLCRIDPTRHYRYDTRSVSLELASELSDADRPVFFLEQDDTVTVGSWPKREPLGRRAS